ncbi:MAG: polysaccharide biosynthesis protein [Xanthomonadales bacterium]|nr:polysaccharide biosynthesis protein [Xanthomonadales bacterium]
MNLANWVGRIHPRIAVVLHDLAMVWLSWVLASRLRWSLMPWPRETPWWSEEVALVLCAQALVFWWTGLYRGLWRFASLPDLWNIGRAAVVGTLTVTLALFLFSRLEDVPRGVLALYPIFLFFALGVPRMAYRYWKDSRNQGVDRSRQRRVLILGAGSAGETLVRDLKRESLLSPVGFLDDSRALRGARVHGVPVLGEISRLPEIARGVAAEMVLIAMPTATNQQMQRVVELCESIGIAFRTVPRLQDVVEGKASFTALKEVAIEDLLGRDPVSLDWSAIRLSIQGRRVLVTGGGGSIGSELCRQVARLGVQQLVVLELSEYNLYRVEQELGEEFPQLDLVCVLGDAGDVALVDRALAEYAVQLVFHAAAFKHVPLLQRQLREAMRNNVLATHTLASCCARRGVERFILVSTDKAVNPANVMGASKRLAEIACQAVFEPTSTRFVTVRFGNVLGSAGSVVPLFRQQIRRGGPVTVTDPDITRYFMTIPEACQLILQAMTLGEGGEVFALDMGEPVRIRYLAEQMILLAGKVPGRDIQIEYTGLRPGEKKFEELFHPQEDYQTTSHPKIWRAQSRAVHGERLGRAIEDMRGWIARYEEQHLDAMLRDWVPELAESVVASETSALEGAIQGQENA